MRENIYEMLPGALLPWYEEHKRPLPWRNTKDPYRIWVSEVMLQQTRVEAVKGYYERFLNALPTIVDLAEADDDLLYKLWEGLGYYSRVRNMKKAARMIVSDHAGMFPGEYDRILALPGVGPYTAGAVASIAFDLRVPAIDGNVLRVITRLTNDETPIDLPHYKQQVWKELAQIYPKEAGAFTQALMELGATVCGPNKKPECDCCPCVQFCQGYRSGSAARLPVKLPKRGRRSENVTVFVLKCEDMYALEKRSGRGLLADMWQFPNVPGSLSVDEALKIVEAFGLHPHSLSRVIERKHIFTHVEWNMTGYYIEVAEADGSFTWMNDEMIRKDAGLPTAFRLFWDEIE